MRINVVSRKLIKPCKPTPPNLSIYKISAIDELNPAMNLPRILYYKSFDGAVKGRNIILLLEDSLAQILPQFYPLGGRYNKEKHQVDCNDEGAEFSVAEVDCQLDELIRTAELKLEQLNHLLPLGVSVADEPTDPMLAIKINRFQCGGLAISVCVSYRIFDSCSLSIFLEAWANAASHYDQKEMATEGEHVVRPIFESPKYYPLENAAPVNFGVLRTPDKSIVTKRFVFDKNAIARLRDSVGSIYHKLSGSEQPPSRVVVVEALLTQALLRADRAKNGKWRSSLIEQAVNVRERTVPPIPKYSCGQWVSGSLLDMTADETRRMAHNYLGMILKIRETTIQGIKDCARILTDKEFGRWAMIDFILYEAEKERSADCKLVWLTDWSKFGEYELDFGFGKPVWVSLADGPFKDLFIMMNTKNNDGIEAWAFLHESDMRYLEQDEELRTLTGARRARL